MSMYIEGNPKTKKAFRAMVAEEQEGGPQVEYYQPGPFGGNEPLNGTIYIEGPHYPEAHSWYADVEVENYVVIKIHS